ncbi:MAG: BREX-1 system adenine-specific DNA-methyltransferase PglX [Prevotella sp.]|nr:BREX-1 system adenine-specific DNA-methyltransferase PglX [Prevotella sp.]
MDTNRIKKFAVEARNKLKAGVAAKITMLGFDRNGNVPEHLRPELMQGGSLWNGQLQTESFFHQWQALYARIKQKGIKEVYEEAAYTWFNRLVAIRILQKNGIIEPVLEYVDAARTPRIVDEARMGRLPQMQETQRTRLMELLDDDSRMTEQFAVLIAAFCHNNAIINACFGSVADYTELLLPNDILTEGGFVDLLNQTEFITDSDFHSPELIGWLYQFYISERKDEVFAKKGKYNADEIPAATQIFTPNWIVKYMVQNTIGRIYLDNHPRAASEFAPKWQYLVEPSEPTPEDAIFKFKELTELLTGDLACGSGHILNECFDLFYDLYLYEGYGRREAIEKIFKYNLRGIDLDTRAKQLATFSLLLKACQKDASFADAHILPMVLNMPKPIPSDKVTDSLPVFFNETPSRQTYEDLIDAFALIKDADSLGSIMKFDIAESTRLAIVEAIDYWSSQSFIPEAVEEIKPAMSLIITLTDKYAALVMNPPYMGSSRFDDSLYKYICDNYVQSKADLFAVFMEVAVNRLSMNGKYGMINMHSWMFISSFELLRRAILEKYHIDSLLHLGPRTFDDLSGEVVQNAAFIISNHNYKDGSIYFRIVDGKNCSEKEQMFLNALDNNVTGICFPQIKQSNFMKIPGCILGYWISNKMLSAFNHPTIGDFAAPRQGLATSDNNRFLRLWHEPSIKRISFNSSSREESVLSKCKWFPYNKGGSYRKWYGNNEYIINWEHDGQELLGFAASLYGSPTRTIKNIQHYFKESITWSALSSGYISLRYSPAGYLFDTTGQCIFTESSELKAKIMAFLNSKPSIEMLKVLSPTLHFNSGVVAKLPYIDNDVSVELIDNCISISKLDWDSQETSWDFAQNELVAINEDNFLDIIDDYADFHGLCIDPAAPEPEKLEWRYDMYKMKWETNFYRLKQNEEELNRQFIEIYGLQEELEEFVPTSEITILQQGEITVIPEPGDDSGYGDTIRFNADVIMKQLISYAVGVWMGRYRLDKPGLNIAHPNPTDEELASYSYNGEEVRIDDDGIIPILPQNSPFDDNLSSRITDFIRITFGTEKLTENLNFMEQSLGTTIDNYVQKDFWKDHKKMYQNRPIYWLFSSAKGAFKCLAYMHRMDAYTAERVRQNYLLPYIEYLQNQIADLEKRAASLSTAENRKLQNFQKALEECREYHERLQVVAEHAIAFDLDDGVVVNYAKFGDVLAKIK